MKKLVLVILILAFTMASVIPAFASSNSGIAQVRKVSELIKSLTDSNTGTVSNEEVAKPVENPVVVKVITITNGENLKATDTQIVVNGEKVKLEQKPILIRDRTMVPARTVFSNLGIQVDWYPDTKIVKMIKGDTVLSMKIGDKVVKVNNHSETVAVASVLIEGTVMVPIRYVAQTFSLPLAWNGISKVVSIGYSNQSSRGDETKRYTVVVDAGHGGYEPGAVSNGVKEKDLNLEIAKRLNALLNEAGIKTYMTREDDTYVDLYDRSGLANNVNADLFISIHNNAGYSNTTGSMSLYYPSTERSKGNLTPIEFAKIVQKELLDGLNSKDLAVIQRPGLAVLRTTNMPAVIAEVGYVTNKGELAELLTSEYQQKAAKALEKAVLEALSKI